MKKIGQMEKYFSRKNVANYRICYFEKQPQKFNKVKNLFFSLQKSIKVYEISIKKQAKVYKKML